MKFLLALLLLPSLASAVNLQTCTIQPTSGGLIGCPTANVKWAPVEANTLVRSQTIPNGSQGWRPYGSLNPATAQVVSQADGGWHPLSALVVSTLPVIPTPPPVIPPVVTPPVSPPATTQTVIVTQTDGTPNLSAIFSGLPIPACFLVGLTKVCTP